MKSSEHGAACPSEQHRSAHPRDLLPLYVTALLLGQPIAGELAQVAEHLACCPQCSAELRTLQDLVSPLYAGTLEPAAPAPALDLSFLPAPPPPQPAHQQGGLMRRLELVLDRQLETLRSRWGAAGTRPALLAARGAPLLDFEPSPEGTGGISFSVQIYPAAPGQSRCDIKVAVVLPEGAEAPGGIALTLQVDEQIWEAVGDETGLFMFEQAVPPDAQVLRIRAEILPAAEPGA